jgi:hypothetical protein
VPILPATRKEGCDLVVVIDLFCIKLIWELVCPIDLEFHLLQKKICCFRDRPNVTKLITPHMQVDLLALRNCFFAR